jgi:hypothetical protein
MSMLIGKTNEDIGKSIREIGGVYIVLLMCAILFRMVFTWLSRVHVVAYTHRILFH